MKYAKIRGLGLRTALILYVIVPLAASVAASGFLAMKMWERQIEERLQSDLEMVARAIQLPLSHAMERNRTGGVEQALESAMSLDSVYSAYAYDLQGRQIAAAGVEDPEPEAGKLSQLAVESRGQGEYGHIGRRSVYSYFAPLRDSRDQSSGLLQLTRRKRDFHEYIGRVRRQAILLLGLGVLAMTALVLVGQYQALGRHFKTLTASMEQVGKGDLEHRISLEGPKEMVAIADSFNRMLDSIQAAENEIKRNRKKRLTLERQLKESEKLAAIGQLAAGVAHELGTPLSTIGGMAQRELRHVEAHSIFGKTLCLVQREVKRMETIIHQLLTFSHRHRLYYRTVNPNRLVQSAMAAVADEAASRGATLAFAQSSHVAVFSADPIRLEQALVNVLRNAIQSGDHVKVRMGCRSEEGQVVFSVEDNGPGIPQEVLPRLFEPFFTTKPVGAGTGLGLAMVHGIVNEHGGCVTVGKSDSGGARFDVHLPTDGDA